MSLDDKIRNAQSAKGSADRGRKRVNYELRIRRLLKDAGIYSSRLEAQIVNVAMACRLRDRLADELEDASLLVPEITAGGVEKKVANPLLQLQLKVQDQINDGYKALGLNFDAKSSNISDALSSDTNKETKLGGLLRLS